MHTVEHDKAILAIQLIIFLICLGATIVFRQKEYIQIKNNHLHLHMRDFEATIELAEESYCDFPKSYTEMVVVTPKAQLTARIHRFRRKKLLEFLQEHKLYNKNKM